MRASRTCSRASLNTTLRCSLTRASDASVVLVCDVNELVGCEPDANAVGRDAHKFGRAQPHEALVRPAQAAQKGDGPAHPHAASSAIGPVLDNRFLVEGKLDEQLRTHVIGPATSVVLVHGLCGNTHLFLCESQIDLQFFFFSLPKKPSKNFDFRLSKKPPEIMFALLLLIALAAAMTPLHDPLHDHTGKAPVAHKCIHDKVAQVRRHMSSPSPIIR
jgi:hypothetical protein